MNEHDPKDTQTKRPIPDDVRQHFRAARQEMRAGFKAWLPPEVLAHGRRARREMLLAWRGVIDAALQRLQDEQDETND